MITDWRCNSIGSGQRNFVTGGVHRISGRSKAGQGDCRPWSMILKIVKADPKRDDPSHYNYWQREILAYDSGYLDHLPADIAVPKCLAIDYQSDGSIWIWLEDIPYDERKWEWEDYAYAAEKLGQFQAAYLLGEPLPEFQWMNRKWMQSWIKECYRYRYVPSIETSKPLLPEKGAVPVHLFTQLEGWVTEWLAALDRLPRTLAHQDYYEQNILFRLDNQQERKLVLIDWQFVSISGIGEDLGRFFGLSVSRGSVPLERYQEYRELFISSYIRGMRRAGWLGDESLPRFGFLAAFALRSIWEVPKLQEKLEQDRSSPEIQKLRTLTEKQMEAAIEAERLRKLVMMGNGEY